jgi:hypothetical protein
MAPKNIWMGLESMELQNGIGRRLVYVALLKKCRKTLFRKVSPNSRRCVLRHFFKSALAQPFPKVVFKGC